MALEVWGLSEESTVQIRAPQAVRVPGKWGGEFIVCCESCVAKVTEIRFFLVSVGGCGADAM